MPGELVNAPTPAGMPMQVNVSIANLHIVVMEGQGAVNILSQKGGTQPVVQVRNKNNEPQAGVLVTFTSPSTGPGSEFLNGARSMSVITDSAGRAGAVGMTPVGSGAFKLGVSASYQGETATIAISQTNYATVAAATAAGAPGFATPTASTGARPAGLSTRAKGGIIAGIAAAATIGAVMALNHGGSSNTASPALAIPTASIGLGGAPTPGAPH